MRLPFTIKEFLDVFKDYNNAIWPYQWLLILTGVSATLFAIKNRKYDKVIVAILAGLWLWAGIIYHINFFAQINKAAYVFGAVFIFQSLAFLYTGIWRNQLSFQFQPNVYGITGACLIIFSILVYPALNYLNGHSYPYMPSFGVPCPTTIFTLGFLLWVKNRIAIKVILIPIAWSIIGFAAAFQLYIYEDFGLAIAGIISLILIVKKNARIQGKLQT